MPDALPNPDGTNPRRAAVFGYFGEGNLGDDLLLSVLAEEAATNGIELVAGWGATSPWDPPCPTIARSPEATIEQLERSDLCIVGPGGLFHNARAGRPYFDRGLLHIDRVTEHAHALGIPILAIGIGIGPLIGPTSRRVAGRILRRCTDVAVRDDASQDFAATYGVEARRIDDLVIGEFASSRQRRSEGTVVALNLRPWGRSREQRAREEAVAASLQRMIQAGEIERVVGVPMSVGPDPRTSDVPPLERVLRQVGGETHLVAVNEPEDAIEAIASSDVLLGMRLHAVILGANHGIPTIAIPYNEKVRSVPREGTVSWTEATIPESTAEALRSALATERRERLTPRTDRRIFRLEGSPAPEAPASAGPLESIRLGIGL